MAARRIGIAFKLPAELLLAPLPTRLTRSSPGLTRSTCHTRADQEALPSSARPAAVDRRAIGAHY